MSAVEWVYAYIASAGALGIAYGVFNIIMLQSVPVGEETSHKHTHPNDMQYLETLIGRKYEKHHRQDPETGRIEKYDLDVGPYYQSWDELVHTLHTISDAISSGAIAFLYEQYKILAIFILLFAVVIALLVEEKLGQFYTVFAFVLGALTSIASGYIGMKVAVFANSRTAYSAINRDHGLSNAFVVAFRGGCVLGFILTALGLVNLLLLILAYEYLFANDLSGTISDEAKKAMYEAIAGYGLGGSTIALFGRVGGGIYTKAADVGADLAGKVEAGLEEDDPRNPATIADNVGDNVGDIAGMGADLFGSFAESSCATLVVACSSDKLLADSTYMLYPLMIMATGIFVCFVTSFFATNLMKVDSEDKIEWTLKWQLFISTILLTASLYGISVWCLPSEFSFVIEGKKDILVTKNWHAYICVISGLWSGLIVGNVTEYYTSFAYTPVKEVAHSCRSGAAPNIIYGLALGYLSCIVPTLCLAATIYVSYKLAAMYGIALAALGMLSNLCIALAIDGYGPISDNAGGMVEMVHLQPQIRKRTDALDAAGNTTAAIGKGFAIGSAALVSLALFGAYVTRVKLPQVNILESLEFTGLLIGAMMPYAFSALTMKSVGKAANEMVEEVRRQFQLMREDPNFKPQYDHCVRISTQAALKEMILPGLMVLLTPLVMGWLLGEHAVAGLLAGILVSGVQMATSSANSGGAWDNAKKYIEKEGIVSKASKDFKSIKAAAVTGDTVGDPMKDTSGPSLNILVKLSAILSLVFAKFFTGDYGGILLKI
jgi:H(+)-translocating pyrophosphatase